MSWHALAISVVQSFMDSSSATSWFWDHKPRLKRFVQHLQHETKKTQAKKNHRNAEKHTWEEFDPRPVSHGGGVYSTQIISIEKYICVDSFSEVYFGLEPRPVPVTRVDYAHWELYR